MDPELSTTPNDFSAIQGVAFNGSVGTFTSARPGSAVADFTATIDWGDGSPTSSGTITSMSGTFTVGGSHTYALNGVFTVSVAITDITNWASGSIVDSATVEPELSGTANDFSAVQGVAFDRLVGTFTSARPGSAVADFSATIDWGDGSPISPATSITFASGTFAIRGSHTYALNGVFTVSVTITDATNAVTGSIVDTATVVGPAAAPAASSTGLLAMLAVLILIAFVALRARRCQ